VASASLPSSVYPNISDHISIFERSNYFPACLLCRASHPPAPALQLPGLLPDDAHHGAAPGRHAGSSCPLGKRRVSRPEGRSRRSGRPQAHQLHGRGCSRTGGGVLWGTEAVDHGSRSATCHVRTSKETFLDD
jgi:hypothetical protein